MEASLTRAVPFILLGKDRPATSGSITIRTRATSERLTGAALIFFVSMLAGAVFVAVPLLHFLLVPLAILIAFAGAFRSYSKTEKIEGGKAPCPYCSAEVKIFPRTLRFPFQDICESCGRPVTVAEAAGSPPRATDGDTSRAA